MWSGRVGSCGVSGCHCQIGWWGRGKETYVLVVPPPIASGLIFVD